MNDITIEHNPEQQHLDELGISYKKHKAIMNICQADVFVEPILLSLQMGTTGTVTQRFIQNLKQRHKKKI